MIGVVFWAMDEIECSMDFLCLIASNRMLATVLTFSLSLARTSHRGTSICSGGSYANIDYAACMHAFKLVVLVAVSPNSKHVLSIILLPYCVDRLLGRSYL